ncbi:MAG: hypothetical protein ACUVSQ_08030 [Pseudanabaenaceae cyanobacterium]
MHELEIMMLGSTGVGKTSLLAAMYDRFASTIGAIDLQLTADPESSAILQDRLIELKTLVGEFDALGGVQGTAGEPTELRSFRFGLGRKGRSPSLGLQFWDYPGGYHLVKASAEQREFVRQLVQKCVAVLVPIDAPALMEEKGKWHEKMNRPQQISNLLKETYQDLDSPRLVLLAPVRCEKYMKDKKLVGELLQYLRAGYGPLLDHLAAPPLRGKVVVVVTPVQTIGSVVFSRIEMKEGQPYFRFRADGFEATYQPKDSEQPLRYLLRFLLSMHHSYQQNRWGWFGFLREIFGLDDYLVTAVRQLSTGCKLEEGFAIWQGESHLKL